jgi:hypothetical protein
MLHRREVDVARRLAARAPDLQPGEVSIQSLLIGAAFSIAHRQMPDQRARSIRAQFQASHFVQTAILLFVVKLGFVNSRSKVLAAKLAPLLSYQRVS